MHKFLAILDNRGWQDEAFEPPNVSFNISPENLYLDDSHSLRAFLHFNVSWILFCTFPVLICEFAPCLQVSAGNISITPKK
jgi:hypothetical protein